MAQHLEQYGVQYCAQGHFDMYTAGAGDRTSDLPPHRHVVVLAINSEFIGLWMACIQSVPAMFLPLHMSVVCWLHLCCEWRCINTAAKLQHTVHHPLYSNYTICRSSSDLHTWLYGCMKMLFRSWFICFRLTIGTSIWKCVSCPTWNH